MKTFAAVILYASMVAAIDLSGVLWHRVQTTLLAKTSVVPVVDHSTATKAESIGQPDAASQSDT